MIIPTMLKFLVVVLTPSLAPSVKLNVVVDKTVIVPVIAPVEELIYETNLPEPEPVKTSVPLSE